MFGKNAMKVCYTEPGLEGGEGGFTKYEGTATSSSTAVLLWLVPVEGTHEIFKSLVGPMSEAGATSLGFVPA